MSKTQTVTLRVPVELKARLEHEAKHQGVSLNNLANYFLTTQLSQVEAISMIDERISKKNISKLKSKVGNMLDAVPNNKEIPDWDAVK
ncbi:toxin-antitoxin system HicB family antitoxin [Candidatus Thiosymbion oneisti]|uniref:toxin-antitoxin system HicB family antitoxin n=1 Tax=Candidatus Thiosymbion oneisti TaxID=589554 RepID=UPI00106058F8|nr:toxin-antitoxin system HicB family antitoxin [Candidatus Thiosymbion oneisti]